ncbi:MAG: glycosyltransferase, partial [Candidatus Riflebacteria bacterium]|nr:glycosyltransferase [Candidatus Riflebacteria bacterium]
SDKVNIWREVVDDGAGIAGPCDREWFAREIDNLLQNPDLQKKMGEHGIESVKKRYSWNQIALQLESAYTEIIARNEKQKSARTD